MFLPLAKLGDRIVICGPSASGKSTLAAAIGRRADLPVVHLDALRFEPGSDWVERSREDFGRDAAVAASGERWVIEGNYFGFIAPRLARATGIIALEGNRFANYLSYLRRSLFDRQRIGGLPGGSEAINWTMTKWILDQEPKRRAGKLEQLRASGLPMVEAASRGVLKRLYTEWNLSH